MSNLTRNKDSGKFCSPYSEPLNKNIIGLRLPASMEEEVRQLAGKDLSGWIRDAIAQKLAQERNKIVM